MTLSKLKEIFVLSLLFLSACALPAPEREAQEFVPDSELEAVSLVHEGLDFYNRGRFFDAELNFRLSLHLFPNALNIKENLAVVLRSEGLTDEALVLYKELLTVDPKSSRYLTGLAQTYVVAGEFALARKVYEQVLEQAIETGDNGLVSSHSRSLAVIAWRLGDEESARCHSEVAMRAQENAGELSRHARMLLAVGDFKTAQSLIESFSANHPEVKPASVLTISAMTKFAKSEFLESKEYLDEALAIRQVEPGLHYELSVMRELLNERLAAASGNEAEPEHELSDEEAEEILNLFSKEAFNANVVLFWPAPLLEAYAGRLHDQPVL